MIILRNKIYNYTYISICFVEFFSYYPCREYLPTYLSDHRQSWLLTPPAFHGVKKNGPLGWLQSQNVGLVDIDPYGRSEKW